MFFLATNDLFSLFNRNYLIKAMSIISPRCDIRYLIFVVFLDFYMIQMIILFILNKYVRNFLLFSRYGYLWHIYSSLARNHDAAAMSIKCSRRMKVTECARKRIVQGAHRVVRYSLVFPVLLQAQ